MLCIFHHCTNGYIVATYHGLFCKHAVVCVLHYLLVSVQACAYACLQVVLDEKASFAVICLQPECLWRDVFCTVLYYQIFQYMEDSGILNVDDEVYLFALHYIFLPRINDSLQ